MSKQTSTSPCFPFLSLKLHCSLQSLSDRLAGPLRLIYLPQATGPGFFPILNCCVSKKIIDIYIKVIGYLTRLLIFWQNSVLLQGCKESAHLTSEGKLTGVHIWYKVCMTRYMQ